MLATITTGDLEVAALVVFIIACVIWIARR